MAETCWMYRKKKPVLLTAMKHTRIEWPDQLPMAELQPHHARRDDIEVEKGCVMMGGCYKRCILCILE